MVTLRLSLNNILINIKLHFTARNSSYGKVMFSQAFIKNSVHNWGGVCLGVVCPGQICLGVPTQRGVCQGGVCLGTCLLRQCVCLGGVSAWGLSAHEGVCPGDVCLGGVCPRGVCLGMFAQEGAVCQGRCLSGGICLWGCLPRGYLPGGVFWDVCLGVYAKEGVCPRSVCPKECWDTTPTPYQFGDYGQQARSTHPTGMYTRWKYIYILHFALHYNYVFCKTCLIVQPPPPITPHRLPPWTTWCFYKASKFYTNLWATKYLHRAPFYEGPMMKFYLQPAGLIVKRKVRHVQRIWGCKSSHLRPKSRHRLRKWLI